MFVTLLQCGFHRTMLRLRLGVRIAMVVMCIPVAAGWPVSNGLASTLSRFPDIKRYVGSSPVSWGEVQNMVIGEIPISTLPFLSSRSAIDVASRFSNGAEVFQRVLSMPGQLILSGMKDEWHWVAVLNDEDSGSYGYVSAMSVKTVVKGSRPAWLVPEWSSQFSISNAEGDDSLVQHVHHVAGSHVVVRKRIMEGLLNHGWKQQSDVGGIAGQWRWHRNHQQLSVLVIPQADGALVLTQQPTRGMP